MTSEFDAEQAEAIRRSAYFFWEQAGRPDGNADYYWTLAEDAHRRQADYDRWLAEGAAGTTENIKDAS